MVDSQTPPCLQVDGATLYLTSDGIRIQSGWFHQDISDPDAMKIRDFLNANFPVAVTK